ncbi:hypothetical protein B9Q03_09355 [Candidatus Marsarchaeota G2 archaeon OSP_D]|uniref:Uncharacterized protein n=1 Tax=Candidatus Marsarchaeota G2 archaeon OSP_D TaxID=1978157 RepID=A0A2R6APS7_9ARCH|nr:MAG: hypothetical protein B9Q03_09355 [Candidatus Marsarchaeota G2 archaeon OSP_D]
MFITRPNTHERLEMVRVGVAYRVPEIEVHRVELPYNDVDAGKKALEPTRRPTRITRGHKESTGWRSTHNFP